MDPKAIFFFALVAVTFAAESSDRKARSLVYTTGVGIAPTYYEATVPTYNYYRTRNLNQYPPGVDPIKCPNYPYCGTDAGSLVVPPVVPIVSAPIAHVPIIPTTRVLYKSPLALKTVSSVPLIARYPSRYFVIRK